MSEQEIQDFLATMLQEEEFGNEYQQYDSLDTAEDEYGLTSPEWEEPSLQQSQHQQHQPLFGSMSHDTLTDFRRQAFVAPVFGLPHAYSMPQLSGGSLFEPITHQKFMRPGAYMSADFMKKQSSSSSSKRSLTDVSEEDGGAGDSFESVMSTSAPVQSSLLKRPRQDSSTLFVPAVQQPQRLYSPNEAVSHVVSVQVGSEQEFTRGNKTLLDFIESAKAIILTLHPMESRELASCRRVITSYCIADGHSQVNSVLLMTPAIGQKSYGTEKRFFCPPPMSRVCGSAFTQPTLQPAVTTAGLRQLPEFTMSADPTGHLLTRDCGGQPTQMVARPHPPNSVQVVFRNMHIGDVASMRKLAPVQLHNTRLNELYQQHLDIVNKREFQLSLHVTGGGAAKDHEVGTFHSHAINLISKPSKKKSNTGSGTRPRKTSPPPSDGKLQPPGEQICDGQLVSLFNRVKNQNVSTRCLALHQTNDTTNLISKNVVWHPFRVVIVHSPTDNELLKTPFVTDGTIIQLQSDSPYLWKSKLLRVRVLELKNQLSQHKPEIENVVCNLCRICLEFVDSPGQYMSIGNGNEHVEGDDSVIQTHMKGAYVSESLVWTIVGVNLSLSEWYREPTPNVHAQPLPATPCPQVTACIIKHIGPQSTPILQQNGSTQRTIIAIDVQVPVYSWFDLVDRIQQLNPGSVLKNAAANTDYRVYVGNVYCQTLHTECFVTLANGKQLLASGVLDANADQANNVAQGVVSVKMRTIAILPSIEDCATRGSWHHCSADLQLQQRMSQFVSADKQLPTQLPPGDCQRFPQELANVEHTAQGMNIEVPIVLVRKIDASLYPTRHTVKYSVAREIVSQLSLY